MSDLVELLRAPCNGRPISDVPSVMNQAADEIERLREKRDEFKRRLTFIQDGHDPYSEIARLQEELDTLKADQAKEEVT